MSNKRNHGWRGALLQHQHRRIPGSSLGSRPASELQPPRRGAKLGGARQVAHLAETPLRARRGFDTVSTAHRQTAQAGRLQRRHVDSGATRHAAHRQARWSAPARTSAAASTQTAAEQGALLFTARRVAAVHGTEGRSCSGSQLFTVRRVAASCAGEEASFCWAGWQPVAERVARPGYTCTPSRGASFVSVAGDAAGAGVAGVAAQFV